MKKPATIMIEGRRYLWRDILALRKAQIEEAKRIQQPALFALPDYSCGDGGKDRCRCFLSILVGLFSTRKTSGRGRSRKGEYP